MLKITMTICILMFIRFGEKHTLFAQFQMLKYLIQAKNADTTNYIFQVDVIKF